MSSTVSFNVKGITDPIRVHGEYTDEIVNTFWAPRFQTIADIFNKNSALDALAEDPDPNFEELTPDDALALWTAVNELKEGAANGIDSATGLPVPIGQQPEGRLFYLTIGMASSLNNLIKSLDSVGFDTVNVPNLADPDLVNQVKRWQDLDDVGLREILIKMGNAVSSNRTLQALIELEYVKAGNELIGNQLEELDEALRITRDVLDTLGAVQSMHNKITAATRQVSNENAEWFTFIPGIQQWDPPELDGAVFAEHGISGGFNPLIMYNAERHGGYIPARDALNDFINSFDGPITNVADADNPAAELIARLDALADLIDEYNGSVDNLETRRKDLNDELEANNAPDYLKVTYQIPKLDEVPRVNTTGEWIGSEDTRQTLSEDDGLGFSVRLFADPRDVFGGSGFENSFNNTKDWENGLNSALDLAFREPLGTVIDVTAADVNQFVKLQNDLVQLKDRLTQLNPDSPLIERIETILLDMTEAPADRPVAMTDSGFIIGDDAEDPLNRLLFWISDGYQVSDATDAGINQRHITEAITNAQGLNDTQKEELRRFIYLFEQFYKSSSAMLQAIDRMINKMAQGIKG